MAFYEVRHDFDANYLFWGDGTDFSYPLHVHRCPEVLSVVEGEMTAYIEERQYDLKAGDCLLIWSNQVHSYHTVEHSKHELCIFAPELIQRFFLLHANEVPQDAMIRSENAAVIAGIVRDLKMERNIFAEKGLLYLMCGEFEKYVTFDKRTKGSQETGVALLTQILTYVNENYQGDCSLSAIASALRYEKTYLSKFFSRNVGITLADYVLQLRLAHSKRMLLNSDESIIKIGEASGFNSLRTFNRNFIEQFGITPSQYRIQKASEVKKRFGKNVVVGKSILPNEKTGGEI